MLWGEKTTKCQVITNVNRLLAWKIINQIKTLDCVRFSNLSNLNLKKIVTSERFINQKELNLLLSKRIHLKLFNCFSHKYYRVTKKKHANWSFLGEIMQPNLSKFAYNIIRIRRVRIWSPILTILIPSVPKSRFKFSKNSKNHLVRFFD